MTLPRTVYPGDIVFVSRRNVARFFLMRPDREMNDAFGYRAGEGTESAKAPPHFTWVLTRVNSDAYL